MAIFHWIGLVRDTLMLCCLVTSCTQVANVAIAQWRPQGQRKELSVLSDGYIESARVFWVNSHSNVILAGSQKHPRPRKWTESECGSEAQRPLWETRWHHAILSLISYTSYQSNASMVLSLYFRFRSLCLSASLCLLVFHCLCVHCAFVSVSP